MVPANIVSDRAVRTWSGTANTKEVLTMTSAYLHRQGAPLAPNHSEYEISMSGVYEILAVHNGELIDNFAKVIDETKPVFLLMVTIDSFTLYRLDHHLKSATDEKPDGGKVELLALKSSDIGAMIVEEKHGGKLSFIKLRVDDESYWVSGTMAPTEQVTGYITAKDLLDFVSGEIPWSALRGRSYICQREQKKELSRQELIEKLQRQLTGQQELHSKVHSQLQELCSGYIAERDSAEEKLEKIPRWVRRLFSVS